MKLNKYLLFLFVAFTVTFLSCKKDDTDNATNANLVGTWAEKPSIEQFTLTFNSNGQGSFQIKNCNTNNVLETESFSYVFDSKTNEILFSGFSEYSIAYVKFFNKTSIRLYTDASYTDDLSEEMYKQ